MSNEQNPQAAPVTPLYRDLVVGEAIVEGDEILSATSGQWVKYLGLGATVEVGDCPFRRPIVPAPLPKAPEGPVDEYRDRIWSFGGFVHLTNPGFDSKEYIRADMAKPAICPECSLPVNQGALEACEMENDILRRGSDAAMRMTEKAIEERDTLRKAMEEIRKMTARRFASMEDVGNFAYEVLSNQGEGEGFAPGKAEPATNPLAPNAAFSKWWEEVRAPGYVFGISKDDLETARLAAKAAWHALEVSTRAELTALRAANGALESLLGNALEHIEPCYCKKSIGYHCEVCDIVRDGRAALSAHSDEVKS
jgi:hypothetical protein